MFGVPQAYLFMFFGVSLIYTDLLELQPIAHTDVDGAPVASPALPAAALAATRTSRSPFALLIFAAALLMTVGLLCGFVVTAAPFAVGVVNTVSWSSLVRAEALPWLVVAVLVTVLYVKERRARREATRIADALRMDELDKMRADSYPAKYVAASRVLSALRCLCRRDANRPLFVRVRTFAWVDVPGVL